MSTIGVKRPFKRLAQMGYGARGAVYFVIGGLAVMAAATGGGKTTDSKGAIAEILAQPLGNVMLTALVIGLVGYVAWRLVQSIKDTDNHGTSGKGLIVRAGLLVSSFTHALLAIWAINLLLGEPQSSGGGDNTWLSSPPGLIALGLAGVAVIGAGFAHMFKGWTARFERYMDIPPNKRKWARPLCQFGLIARGIVWCIIGGFFIQSALMAGAGNVEGIEAALNAIAASAYGTWLLAIVAAGLMAFGFYSILEACYRRINTPEPN